MAEKSEKRVFQFNPVGKEPFEVEEVLTHSSIKLEERMTANVKKGEVILKFHSSSRFQEKKELFSRGTQRILQKTFKAVLTGTVSSHKTVLESERPMPSLSPIRIQNLNECQISTSFISVRLVLNVVYHQTLLPGIPSQLRDSAA